MDNYKTISTLCWYWCIYILFSQGDCAENKVILHDLLMFYKIKTKKWVELAGPLKMGATSPGLTGTQFCKATGFWEM